MAKPKIITIVGPTASGKTDLSIELALKFNGEVISADSRQVYKGLDVGSGKITKEEMRGVKHHLLDVTSPETNYTGADFTKDANNAISDILERGKLPIIVGGTFFYIELLKGRAKSAPVEPNPILRTQLERLSTEELFQELEKTDKNRAENIDPKNRRRLIRSLEIITALGHVPKHTITDSPYEWLNIGINIEKNLLQQRIEERLKNRLEVGMIEEVENLLKSGVSPQWLHDLGLEYRYIAEYLQNKITYEEMLNLIVVKSRQFAKRQYTWLKRDKTIDWYDFPLNLDKVEEKITKFLSVN